MNYGCRRGKPRAHTPKRARLVKLLLLFRRVLHRWSRVRELLPHDRQVFSVLSSLARSASGICPNDLA